MSLDAELAESRRDSTHHFDGSGDDFGCKQCGRPRGLHVFDGFVPSSSPGRLGSDKNGRFLIDPHVKYRGPHPRFSKKGSRITVKAEEFGDKGRKAMGL